jgi:hypothetical protein
MCYINISVKKSSTNCLATSVNSKKLPKVNNCPIGEKLAQSGHPGAGLGAMPEFLVCVFDTQN